MDFVEVSVTKGSATKEQFAASARTTRSPSESARLSKPRVVASTGRRRTGTRRRFSPWAGTRPVGIAARLIAFGVFVLGAMPAAVEAADDYAANTSTTGTVVVGGSQTGELESHGDVDWIRVTLVGGTRYVIDYDGSANGQGTLSDPYFHGVYDANGNLISGTTDSNGGLGFNSRIDFTPGSSGTYFLGLGNGAPSLTGTYRVSVTEFDDYVVEVIVPGDDYEGDITTTGVVSVGGSVVGHFQKALGSSDTDWIRFPTNSIDHDWFRVTFDAGKTYRVHIKGSWTNHGTLRDTRIAGIYDSNGNLIASTVDDNSGIDKEARTIFTASTTGNHYISATRGEFPFPAQDSGTYTVEVYEIGNDDYAASTATSGSVAVDGSTTGTIERLGDLDWFAVTLEGYATYRFDLEGTGENWPLLEGKFIQGIYDSNGNGFAGTYTPERRDDEVRAVFAPEQDGTYYVAVGAGETFFGTGEYRLSATKFIPEVSDWFDTKGRVGVGSYVAGAIEEASDRDWFRVTLEAGTTYQVDLEGSSTNQGTLGDPYLHGIRDSEGDLIWYTTDDNSGVGMNSRVNFTPDSDGTYYIEAGALFGRTGTYRLSVWQETSDDEPLRASYPASAYMSARHKGTDDRPQVVVSFSRPVAAIGADTPSVTVTGGTVANVQAHAEDGVENGRIFFLTPDGNGDIEFALLAGVACDAGGICAADGGLLLSNNPSTTIPGPSVGEPALSVSDASANEADGSIGFAVTLSPAASATVTVDYATADGTATAGADYTATSGTLTFQTGDTQKTISVLIIDDLVEDDGETLTLTLSNASGATLAEAEATGTIHNTEITEPDPLTASFSGAPAEHDGGSAFTFQVQFSEDVGISYVTMRDDAFEVDEGDVTGARRVDGRNDLWEITVEPDGQEAVSITLPGNRACGTTGAVCTRGENPRALSNSPSATVAGPTVAATPTVSISDASGTEGDGDIAFTVTLDSAGTDTVTVDYATSNGTADGDDYTATSGTLTFDAGTTGKTITVPIADDDVNEGDETFTVALSNASGATLGTASATGTIENRYVTPTVSISGGGGKEGDDDAIAFAVTLDSAATDTVTVDYATANGTADGDDYTATSGTLTFDAGTTSGTITVPIADDDENESDETFTVALSNASGATLGTASATGTIENRYVTPLTASFEQVPAEHDGTTFVFHVRFSEDPAVSYLVLKDESFDVTGGKVDKARRKDGRNDLREIHVEPSGNGDVTVSLPPTTDCDAHGAICTADGRPLSHSLSATVAGPVGISVADARAQEGAGNTVDFAVTLSRASSGTVTVGYATADGTATAGQDYTAASGTLTFAPGETSGSVSVPVLDDTHDDDGETFTLTLSNASGGRLTDNSATGTIENSDPIPQAWLARFGRAASDHVMQAIDGRLRGGAQHTRETHFTVGGRQVDSLFSAWDGMGAGFAPTGSDAGNPALADESPWARMDRFRAEALAGPADSILAGGSSAGGGLVDPAGGNPQTSNLYGNSHSESNFADSRTSGSQAARSVLMSGLGLPAGDLRGVLMGSSFFYSRPLGDDGQADAPGWLGQWSAWGETAATHFSGADGPLSLNGEVATAILGADSRWGRWLAGVTLSHSLGEGNYTQTDVLGGALESTLTSVNPYASYQLSDRTNVWGVLGYGVGKLSLTPEHSETALQTGMTNTMAAFGGRTALSVRSGRAGQFELAIRSDARMTSTSSEAIEGLVGVAAQTRRVRLLLEGSGSMPLANGGMLKPTLEAGLRYDAGDAETGAGIEIVGGLGYASGRLAVELNARALMAHEDTAYEEWGFSASLGFRPRDDGSGVSLNLGSAWGVTQSGVQSLWARPDASGLTHGGAAMDAGPRLQAQLGYGIHGPRGRVLWLPYVGADQGGGGQGLQMGVRLASQSSLEAELRLARRQDLQGVPEHAIEFSASMRW